MREVSISEASEILGVSKEAIYNRIRRNSIRTREKNGIKYVILEDENDISQNNPEENFAQTSPKPRPSRPNSPTNANQNFIDYLIAEISELKSQIQTVQEDKDRLYREKEEILISSKEEIKLMYKERDEKLGYFLSFFEKPLLGANPHEKKPYDVEVKEKIYDENEWLSLAKFIKSLDLGRKKRAKAQSLIIENIGKNENIMVVGDELLINKNLQIKNLKNKK